MRELNMVSFTTPRSYRVVRKVPESTVITSFYLEAADDELLAPFTPGQFLTFKIEGLAPGVIWRNYSLSGSPEWKATYRISVKREPAADPAYVPGLVSNHLHDQVNVGDVLVARGPEGRFTLDTQSDRPVVLLSGGVGLTPLVSMMHALARQRGRSTTFVHACENGSVHALGAEVRALAAEFPNLRTCFCYRTPGAGDVEGRDFDAPGIVSRELLQLLLPIDDYDFYLCGPPAFMEGVFGHLISLGVREERIRYEFFGPATVIRSTKTAAPTAVRAESVPIADGGNVAMVSFTEFGITVPWDPKFECLLDFAEAQGLDPAFSCRAGICSSCECELSKGELDYPVEPLEMPPDGRALICCATPRGSISLKI